VHACMHDSVCGARLSSCFSSKAKPSAPIHSWQSERHLGHLLSHLLSTCPAQALHVYLFSRSISQSAGTRGISGSKPLCSHVVGMQDIAACVQQRVAHQLRFAEYLRGIRQKGKHVMPDGPVLLSPSSLFRSFHREVRDQS